MKKFVLTMVFALMVIGVSARSNPATRDYGLQLEDNVVSSAVDFSSVEEGQWVDLQVVEIPFGMTIYEGTTRNGNTKYYFHFEDIGDVAVTENNATKYRNREVSLELVKKYNATTNKYKYTTRQCKSSKANTTNVTDVDITTLFNKKE